MVSAQPGDGIRLPGPPRLLALRAVLLGVVRVVAGEPAGGGDDQRRAFAGARTCGRLGHRLADGAEIAAIDRDAGESVDRRPILERPGREHRLGRRVLGVPVVLADEHDRQAEDRGEAHRFVHRTLVEGAVAERGQCDAAGAVVAGRQRGPGADRRAGPDDAVLAQEPVVGIGEEPGAAPAAVDAGRATHELAEQRLQRDPAGDRPVVPAVGGIDRVGGAQRRVRADGDRLLTVRQVQRAHDHAAVAQLRCVVLELPDRHHRAERRDGLGPGHDGSLTGRTI